MEENKNRLLPAILICVFFILLVVFTFTTRLQEVEITGLTRYSEEEFLELTKKSSSLENAVLFYALENTKGNNKIPFIQSYSVELTGPSSVKIQVYENDVFGCVYVMGSYFFFDMNGMIVASGSQTLPKVPVVSGLEFDRAAVFNQLEIPDDKVFTTITNIVKQLRRLNIDVENINFSYDYEITLAVENVKVLLGRKDDYSLAISALAGVLPKASEIGGTLDMRNYSEENRDIVLK